MNLEPELSVLSDVQSTLIEYPHASQRDISKAINMSLGMTNNILKRFAEKGWIYMKKISTKNIQYILTPDGMKELTRRSFRYMKRTLRNVYDYKEVILKRIIDAQNSGIQNIYLIGEDDIAFIIEYACQKNKINFNQIHNIDEIKDFDMKSLFFFSDNTNSIQNNEIFSKIQKVNILDLLVETPTL